MKILSMVHFTMPQGMSTTVIFLLACKVKKKNLQEKTAEISFSLRIQHLIESVYFRAACPCTWSMSP